MTQDKKNQDRNFTTRLDGVLEDLELAEQTERKRSNAVNQLFEVFIPWVIEFRVIGTPEIIRAPLSESLIIGRDDARNDFYPAINLSPYNGQNLGVSRKHARVYMRDNRITVEDLSSANGTYVNGKHIEANSPVRLRDGDQVKLGNLSLQVHFVVQPHTDDDTMQNLEGALAIPNIGNGERLLILDDNQEVCAVLRMIALQAGFKVSIAHDPTTALTYWDSGAIDGIIVELMLEESNGLDLVDYVRQHANRHVPIIATASIGGGYRENQARSKGVDDLLEKPLSVDRIINALSIFTDQVVS
ncbi:MAG: FHA domain-containing protein [Anaerolineae bacterium]